MVWNQCKLVSGIGLLLVMLSLGWWATTGTAQDTAQQKGSATSSTQMPFGNMTVTRPAYQVTATFSYMDDDQKQLIAFCRPQLVVEAYRKGSIEVSKEHWLKTSKPTPDWWRTGLEVEVDVQPQPNGEHVVQVNAKHVRVRDGQLDKFAVETHSGCCVKSCPLGQPVDLLWEPFGKQAKMQIKVVQVEGKRQPVLLLDQLDAVITPQVVPLKNASATQVAQMIRLLYNEKAIHLTVDAATNSLILQMGQDQTKEIQRVIQQLDQTLASETTSTLLGFNNRLSNTTLIRPDDTVQINGITYLKDRTVPPPQLQDVAQPPETTKEKNPPKQDASRARVMEELDAKIAVEKKDPTKPKLTITVGPNFQMSQLMSITRKLNQGTPQVELDYDHVKSVLSIKILVDDLKLSELTELLNAAQGDRLKR